MEPSPGVSHPFTFLLPYLLSGGKLSFLASQVALTESWPESGKK